MGTINVLLALMLFLNLVSFLYVVIRDYKAYKNKVAISKAIQSAIKKETEEDFIDKALREISKYS